MSFAVFPLAAAAVCFVVFLISFVRDRRRLRNGIYLFFVLLFLGAGLLALLASVSRAAAGIALFVVAALIPLTIVALAVFLICNGITMIRREGRRPANLLSLLAGLGIVAFVPLNWAVSTIDWTPLEIGRATVNTILTYVSFLFVCFLLYSVVYGRIRARGPVDFIVVLGSGLLGGDRVPPLLASRLDRARGLYDREIAAGRQPTLVPSGGQGPGEDVPEAHAMADYLTARGVPADRVVREDASRSTAENLTFSGAIMQRLRPGYRCVVVTNNFHVLRAAVLARRAKVNGQVVGSRTAWYYWPSATIREFVAVVLDHRAVNFTIFGLVLLVELAAAVYA